MPRPDEQFPYWVDLVEKLAPVFITAVIGFCGFYIASRQYKTSRDKLRLDLFEKRLEAFEKLQEYFGFVLRDGTVKDEALQPLHAALYKSRFLFGPEIQMYLKDLWGKAIDMRTLRLKLYSGPGDQLGLPVGPERSAVVEKDSALLLWHSEEMVKVQERYAKYLQFGHVKS
jgi:hypothetical protein